MPRKFFMAVMALALMPMAFASTTASPQGGATAPRAHQEVKGGKTLKTSTPQIKSFEDLKSYKASLQREERIMFKKDGEWVKPDAMPATRADEGEETFKINFAVAQNDETWRYDPWKVYVCKGNGDFGRDYYNYAYFPYDGNLDNWACDVPEGVYDVILAFDMLDVPEGITHFNQETIYGYIVFENYEITGPETIVFNQSDAKNVIESWIYGPDGKEFVMADFSILNEANEDNWQEIEKEFLKTLRGVSWQRFVNAADVAYCLNSQSNSNYPDVILLNDVSDKWTYCYQMVAITENEGDITCLANQIIKQGPFNKSEVFWNDPDKYVETVSYFNNPFTNLNNPIEGGGVDMVATWKGADWSGGGSVAREGTLVDGNGVRIFNNTSRSGLSAETGFDLLVAPMFFTDKIVNYEDWGDGELYENISYAYSEGAPVVIENDKTMTRLPGFAFDREDGERFYLPENEFFSYTVDGLATPSTEYLSYSPFNRFQLAMDFNPYLESYMYYVDNNYYSSLNDWWIGMDPEMKVTFNGEVLPVENGWDFFDWCRESSKETGIFNMQMTAKGYAIGGNESSNVTEVTFDSSKDDCYPPRLNAYKVVDADGKLTNSLSDGEGTLYFAAGDFNAVDMYNDEVYNSDFTVALEIAEMDSDEWTAADIEELPDLEDERGFGKVYSLALADLAADKWYKARFTIEDNSGNAMKQTVNHIFNTLSTVGIAKPSVDSFKVTLDGNRIVAPEGAEVYGIDGRRVDTESVSTGVYVVRHGNTSVKVIVR